MACATSKGSDQPAHTRSLIRAFASRLNILRQLSYCPNTILSFFFAYKEAAQARLIESIHAKIHPRYPRRKPFRYTAFITKDERSETECFTPG